MQKNSEEEKYENASSPKKQQFIESLETESLPKTESVGNIKLDNKITVEKMQSDENLLNKQRETSQANLF